MTTQATLQAALLRRGWYIVPSSRSYRQYVTMAHREKSVRFFLGSAGSCRAGRVYTVSMPVGKTVRDRLLAEGKAHAAQTA